MILRLLANFFDPFSRQRSTMASLMKISTIFDETGFAMGVIATAKVVTMAKKYGTTGPSSPTKEVLDQLVKAQVQIGDA
jgi:hypothetical protein